MNKDETSPPTVSVPGLMVSCIIGAMEQRGVAILDIPGTFLQNKDNIGSTHIKLDGAMLELIA